MYDSVSISVFSWCSPRLRDLVHATRLLPRITILRGHLYNCSTLEQVGDTTWRDGHAIFLLELASVASPRVRLPRTGNVCKVAQTDAERLVCVKTVCSCSERERGREREREACWWSHVGLLVECTGSRCWARLTLRCNVVWTRKRVGNSTDTTAALYFFLGERSCILSMVGLLARVLRLLSCTLIPLL